MRACIHLGLATFVAVSFSCSRSPRAEREGSATPQEAWNGTNDPGRLLDPGFESRLAELPREGRTIKAVWTDYFWPDNRGGAAFRWRSSLSLFKYETLNATEAKALSAEELAKLSPLEKYDIYKGDLTFPSVERAREISAPYRDDWEGLCDAIAALGLNFREPGKATLKNAGGRSITFGSSDVKALLAHYYGRVFRYTDATAGDTCMVPTPDQPDVTCRDVNPGTFHLLLANRLGREGKPFIADMTWDLTSWNHIVTGFQARVVGDVPLGARKALNAKRGVKIGSIVEFLGVASASMERQNPEPLQRKVYLEYVLELDGEGRIVGGEWTTVDHPDFVWTAKLYPPTGYWADLTKIFAASTADLGESAP